jgi:hypothetical protein
MDKEVAKLFLNGSSLSTAQTALGIRTADFRSFTFNVDLRQVLGETLFQNYDKFKAYIWEQSNSTVTNLCTGFVDGLNIINNSYNGVQQGARQAYSVTIAGSNPVGSEVLEKPGNLREHVFIKPNDGNIQLTFSYVNDDGTTSNLSQPIFLLTFVPYEDKIYKNPYNYLYQNEQANFTLSTQILTAGATNAFGTCNAAKSLFTFNNLNMRHIIGTMFDKYDKFNLILRNIGMGQSATALSGNQRRQFFLMSGLQFINATSQTSQILMGQVMTPMFVPSQGSVADVNYFDIPSSMSTFRKPESENTSMTFQLWTTSSGVPLTGGSASDWTLTFAVVGVKEKYSHIV